MLSFLKSRKNKRQSPTHSASTPTTPTEAELRFNNEMRLKNLAHAGFFLAMFDDHEPEGDDTSVHSDSGNEKAKAKKKASIK